FKQSSSDLINEAVIERRLFPLGTPTRTLIVINGTVCGAGVPDVIREGCARLSELSGTALLGVEFVQKSDDDWLFASAMPMPDMRYEARSCSIGWRRFCSANKSNHRRDRLRASRRTRSNHDPVFQPVHRCNGKHIWR